MRKFYLPILVIFLMILAGCGQSGDSDVTAKFTSPIQTCKEVKVPYQATEEYTERVPYQATEEYDIKLKYEVVDRYKKTTNKGFDVWAQSIVEVRNVDSETGKFSVISTFETLRDGETSRRSTQYIMPGETKTFVHEYDVDFNEDFDVYTKIIPGEKTMTREVTKYRTVTKTKTVTKYRMEEKCS
mgnify:CR=1 FL=1